MSCTVADRERVREAAAEIRACDDVLGADALPPGAAPELGWSIEITLTTPLGSAVLERLAAHDLQLVEAGPRGSGYWALATV